MYNNVKFNIHNNDTYIDSNPIFDALIDIDSSYIIIQFSPFKDVFICPPTTHLLSLPLNDVPSSFTLSQHILIIHHCTSNNRRQSVHNVK
jgi:hypothetical protein